MQVTGDTATAVKILSLKNETFRKVIEAIEKTAVRMANHARAGHERGSNPHAQRRYENRTNNLTNSIFPAGPRGEPMQFETVTEDMIVGLFGVNSLAPGAVMEYAPYVEERYPFIFPAAAENAESLRQEVAKAAPGAKGGLR